MCRTLLIRIQERKIRVLEEVVESWGRNHEEALLIRDIEDLIAGCLSCWEDIRRSWMRTRKLAALGRLADLHDAGTTVLALLTRSMCLLEDVTGLAEQVARDTGHVVEGRESLPEIIREAADLRAHVKRTWPWDDRPLLPLDRKMAEDSRLARSRGDSRDVADILADLQATASPQG